MIFALKFLWYFWTTLLLVPFAMVTGSERLTALVDRQWDRCCELGDDL